MAHLDWPGLGRIGRLERTRETGGKASTEAVYLVTNLPPGEAGPERLLELVRDYWAMKTGCTTCATSG